MRRLPPLVQVSVKSSSKTNTEDLLMVADQVFEVYQQQNFSVNAISNGPSTSNAIFELTMQNRELKSEIAEIKDMLSKLNINDQTKNRSRSYSRGRRFSNARSKSRSNRDKVCWYHAKFGLKAQKCVQPCEFKDPN